MLVGWSEPESKAALPLQMVVGGPPLSEREVAGLANVGRLTVVWATEGTHPDHGLANVGRLTVVWATESAHPDLILPRVPTR